MDDFAQLTASITVLIGVWLYGKKHIMGPYVSMFACILWGMIGAVDGLYPMAMLNAILAVVHFRNLLKWVFRV